MVADILVKRENTRLAVWLIFIALVISALRSGLIGDTESRILNPIVMVIETRRLMKQTSTNPRP